MASHRGRARSPSRRAGCRPAGTSSSTLNVGLTGLGFDVAMQGRPSVPAAGPSVPAATAEVRPTAPGSRAASVSSGRRRHPTATERLDGAGSTTGEGDDGDERGRQDECAHSGGSDTGRAAVPTVGHHGRRASQSGIGAGPATAWTNVVTLRGLPLSPRGPATGRARRDPGVTRFVAPLLVVVWRSGLAGDGHDVVRLLPDLLRMTAGLARDPSTPRSCKVALGGLAVRCLRARSI